MQDMLSPIMFSLKIVSNKLINPIYLCVMGQNKNVKRCQSISKPK